MPAPPHTSRRRFLRASAAVAAVTAAGVRVGRADPAFAQTPQPGEDWVRVHLIVIDGLLPEEVAQMPTVAQLAADGFYLPRSRAQMIAETTPNHVSMITGMRADRHGMPGNDVAYLPENIGEDPRYLQCDTIYSLIARQAPDLVTAAATAKSYIVNMSKHERVDPGTEDADATNDPFIVPVSGAAIDAEVGPDALRFSVDLDPDLLWMSLGDVDRVGHSDPTGSLGDATGLPPLARTLSLQTADLQVRNLITALQQDGRWANTVVLLTADHSMDWSLPNATVGLVEQFQADPLLAGATGVAQNGGAAIYWLLAPEAAEAPAQLARMRQIALATEGVAEAWYTRPNPADGGEAAWVGATRPDWGLTGDRTGDLVVVAEDGFRITEPTATSNPIPGNHGHLVTLPIPVVVAGGWDGLVGNDVVPGLLDGPDPEPDVRLADQAENIDIAPTIAWLLGINPPPGGFDGRVLAEAFTRRPAPRVPVADVPSVPQHDRVAGADRLATAVALSQLAFPDPAAVAALVVAAAGDFPDALAATPLAAALGGPLLLTDGAGLSAVTAEEVRRLAPDRIVAVGGSAALADAVLDDLRALGVAVERVAGDSRFATAGAIARLLAPEGGVDVILASGESFPDALAAGPLAALSGRVILLTGRDAVPAATAQALADLQPARILIAGGPAAVGTTVEAALAVDHVVERLSGPDRYATAAALVERAVREGGHTDRAFLVSAADFPDALAAGAAVAALGGILLPVDPTSLAASGAIAELLDRRADGLVQVTVVGGPGAVSPGLEAQVEARLLAVRTRTGELPG